MSASPPHKRLRSDTSVPSAPVASSSSVDVNMNEAPVNAMLPGAVASTSTENPDSSSTNAATVPGQTKQEGQKGKGKISKRKMRRVLPDEYSAGDVLFRDVCDFLGPEYVDGLIAKKSQAEWDAPEGLEQYSEVTVRVGTFTVSGESLSLWPQGEDSDPSTSTSTTRWAILAPFAHPGDLIRVKIIKHDRLHSQADLLEILEYSETYRGGEGDRRVNPDGGCRYFGECGGCQLQPVPYPLQLAHKKTTVSKAYARFSGLSSAEMPPIQDTIGSPKQWGYRTKITPHFDAAPKVMQASLIAQAAERKKVEGGKEAEEEAMNGVDQTEVGRCGHVKEDIGKEEGRGTKTVSAGERNWELRIGFERKGRPGVMDIEECPIATPTLNRHLLPSRAKVQDNIYTYKRGATILLRDSLPAPAVPYTLEHPFDPTATPILPEEDHVPITDHHAAVYERVGDYMFQFSAGSFFQNNNSILVPLLEYVREAIFPSSTQSIATTEKGIAKIDPPTHLVDTYCGSGLFGISLSKHFDRIAGVEISDQSIKAAKLNAEMNGLTGKTSWLVGKAEEIFGGLEKEGFRGRESCVVVDPPRKGCDTPFLNQLLTFAPQTIVYVSCNVHTQARDVGWFVREAEKRGKERWIVESVRGFDLFPQTAHVESVAVLRLDPSSVSTQALTSVPAQVSADTAATAEEDAINA